MYNIFVNIDIIIYNLKCLLILYYNIKIVLLEENIKDININIKNIY